MKWMAMNGIDDRVHAPIVGNRRIARVGAMRRTTVPSRRLSL
jgi:hypothetical protein